MPTVDSTRPPAPVRLDIAVFGVRAVTATRSGYTTEHGDYETLELQFGPSTTLTLAGDSPDDLRHLVATLADAVQ